MRKAMKFAKKLYKRALENNITSLSSELTYKLMLAMFPFLIFAMSLIGFFNLESHYLLEQLEEILPFEAYRVLDVFIQEVVLERSAGVLSFSLLITVFSTSSGFRTIMRGMNKSYGQTETRGFVSVYTISFALTLIFSVVVLLAVVLFVFRGTIQRHLILTGFYTQAFSLIFGISGYLAGIAILVFAIMVMNKAAINKKISFFSIFPGALTTVIIWIAASQVFNLYVSNFVRFSRVYGSLGGVFVLLLWLNVTSYALLIGSEVNGLLSEESE